MGAVARNIPMKFHRSNMKTEGLVRKSLKCGGRQTDSYYTIVPILRRSVGTKTQRERKRHEL